VVYIAVMKAFLKELNKQHVARVVFGHQR